MSPLLSIRKLNKTYENGVQALKGIDLDVQSGEFLVVIGLSGSGKSTLLRCINRLVEPTSGQIAFGNKEWSQARGNSERQIRRQIAMIFQHFNLVPRHTVLSNVLMGRLAFTSTLRSLVGNFSAKDRQDAIEFLKTVGLEDWTFARADQLSGGQQQRVAIARALLQNPKLLLADEPVSSLDPATCHTVMSLLKRINQRFGITVICNLHFLSLVRQYATRVIALRDGEIVYTGSPQDISSEWFKTIFGPEAEPVEER